MKLTKSQLKQIIKEELKTVLKEEADDYSVEKLSNGLIRIRKKDSGLVGLYNSDGSYKSGDLRLSQEKVKGIIKEERQKLDEQGERSNSSSALQAINDLEKKLKTLGFTGPRVLHLLDELSNATMFPERKDWGAT